MIAHAGGRRYTLLTGATGFIGHVLAAELLSRGQDCAILARRPMGVAVDEMARLLGELGLDAAQLVEQGRLVYLEGSLPDDLPENLPFTIERIVHAAASTRFDADETGEPTRTNDHGTGHLFAWAERQGINEFHHISTAYSSGVTVGPVPEAVSAAPVAFRNAYERSKWKGELHAARWARGGGRSCTIYRPSIVVGDHTTGRAARFNGLYLALRAFDKCARGVKPESQAGELRHLPLRIEGNAHERLNFIPVDHLAGLVADIIEDPSRHGVIYNLVDPAPLTNQQLLDAIQTYYGVTGATFEPPERLPAEDLNEAEQSFAVSTRPQRPYFVAPPVFERDNVAAVESAVRCPWPKWDDASIGRLIEFARQQNWGRALTPPTPPAVSEPVADYFQRFLPERIVHSGLAGMTALSTTFRFVVDGVRDGEWVCRFHEGRLAEVGRSDEARPVDFTYRMDERAFIDIVSARVDPQDVFLEGRAEVSGDFERALKMGMILQQFNREQPYPCVAADVAISRENR